MDKKEIYEHLAKIYLDASKKKKTKALDSFEVRDLLLVSLIVIGIYVLLALAINLPKSKFFNANNPSLVIKPDIVKIAFSSNPLDNRLYSFDLNNLNLKKFSVLGFSARKINYQDNIILKVELINSSNERSRVYLKNLDVKWNEFKVYLSDFSHISDWSKIKRLSFAVAREGTGKIGKEAVYIDEIKFIK